MGLPPIANVCREARNLTCFLRWTVSSIINTRPMLVMGVSQYRLGFGRTSCTTALFTLISRQYTVVVRYAVQLFHISARMGLRSVNLRPACRQRHLLPRYMKSFLYCLKRSGGPSHLEVDRFYYRTHVSALSRRTQTDKKTDVMWYIIVTTFLPPYTLRTSTDRDHHSLREKTTIPRLVRK